MKDIKKKIPVQVIKILDDLEKAGFQAYIVGGCVRDLLIGKEVKDWDITTDAEPEKIMEIFPDSFYENEFGTVGVKIEKEGEGKEVVEVTTFRTETSYSDKRHPDKVKFAKTLEEDLSRRDFTINAMAIKPKSFEIVDLFGGQKDLSEKMIQAVGEAEKRFSEDALRMMRAVRFSAELGFSIEKKTAEAIKNNSKNLKFIAKERIKDELTRIILSQNPASGIENLRKLSLLSFVIPELEQGVGMSQNRHHIYTIWKHSLLSLENCPSKKLTVRMAALLHDISKPDTKRGEGEFATFYNHDHIGAGTAEKILGRLKFSKKIIEKVKLLVDNHMFYYNVDEVGESSVRRLIQKVGLSNMKDLINLRIADRLGSGVPKAKPYKLRHLEYMIEKVSRDAISVKMLKVSGNDLIEKTKIKPGPQIGAILDVLLAEVIDDASCNNEDYLLKRAEDLKNEKIEGLRKMAKRKIEEKKEEDEKEIKKKYWVK